MLEVHSVHVNTWGLLQFRVSKSLEHHSPMLALLISLHGPVPLSAQTMQPGTTACQIEVSAPSRQRHKLVLLGASVHQVLLQQ